MELLRYDLVTSSGTASPPSGATACRIECISGGGSGGSAAATTGSDSDKLSGGSGGAGGGKSIKWMTSGIPGQFDVTIGAGGAAPSAGAYDGNDGGDTVVSSNSGATVHCSATGGKGGLHIGPSTNAWNHGLAGGNAYGGVGDEVMGGQPGGICVMQSGTNSQLRMSGRGGASAEGVTGGKEAISNDSGHGGGHPGGGGSGALSWFGGSSQPGGVGAAGVVRIWWYG